VGSGRDSLGDDVGSLWDTIALGERASVGRRLAKARLMVGHRPVYTASRRKNPGIRFFSSFFFPGVDGKDYVLL